MENTKNSNEQTEKYYCSECGIEVSIEDNICPKCGADLSEIEEEEVEELTKKVTPKRYAALRTLSGIYSILAWVTAISAIFALIYGMIENSVVLIFSSIIYGLIGTITVLAFSEGIKLFIDLENNTRIQIDLLTKLNDKY